MSDSLAGQSAIVTGGARGIGLGIARRLAADGAKVILWDKDFRGFDADTLGFPAEAIEVDVSDLGSVTDGFAASLRHGGPIGIFVNNAGINGPVGPTWEYPPEAWDLVLKVDLTGVFYCCRVVVPHMREEGYGRIVNISSIAGKEGNPGIAAYSAAKAGVIGLTKALAKELVGSGVLVNCVTPVITETDIFSQMTQAHIDAMKAKIPMGRFLKVEEIAAMVSWVCSPDCSFTTGGVFDISGGRATY